METANVQNMIEFKTRTIVHMKNARIVFENTQFNIRGP